MSTRLDYQSPELVKALETPEALRQWEEKQYQAFQNKGNLHQLDDILACAELALRLEKADDAQKHLEKALKNQPKSADAFYLKAQLHALQGQKTQALEILNQAVKVVPSRGVDSGRLYALKAQLHFSENTFDQASKALYQAYLWAGMPKFVHSFHNKPLHKEALVFDLELFDALYPWSQSPLETRFCALSVDADNQVYILENRNKWLFKLNDQGELIQGLNQRQLANSELVMPEEIMSLTDLVATTEAVYITGAQDTVQKYDAQLKAIQRYQAPASERTLKPLSMAQDTQGNLYVIYIHLPGIQVFNAEGFHMGSFGGEMRFARKNYYCGLAVDAYDKLYLYDRTEVHVFDCATQKHLRSFSPAYDTDLLEIEEYPFCWNGIAANQGNIYLACTYENQVQVFNTEGQHQETLEGLNQPMDLALGSDNTLWVADTGSGQILKYTDQKWVPFLTHSSFVGINHSEVS